MALERAVTAHHHNARAIPVWFAKLSKFAPNGRRTLRRKALGSTMSEVLAAVLGALIVWATTFFMEARKKLWAKRENSAHLGVVVLVLLEGFIAECAKVAGDDGTVMGQPAGRHDSGEEYYLAQTEIPKLDLGDLKVEWRSISPNLMYSIHSIPLYVTEALEYLSDVSDNDFPPFDAYIFSRQKRFAELGVQVAQVAANLRAETGVPPRSFEKWSSEQFLRDQLATLTEIEEKQQATQENSTPKIAHQRL